ncbi:phage tail protein [Yokenella regensburgei]|uniref:phage tail protein n=1 Tax=Yokenella regensburgei TaxID=158877 RepID=UPI001ED92D23|nr:phage tail protein [Yokenella regensburgei]KAF1367125.1 hypothetical protein FHR25_004340 [Yokenella regensburgei]
MSQTVITLAFEQWKARQGETGEPVLLDEFVLANVPGLDPGLPIDRNEGLPPAAQIVHRQSVTRKGVVNENAVVHSVVLGADVGDFSFNWIGLMNKTSGTLAMIVHAPVQQKLKTKDGQQGNVLTRSFLMEYNGAQSETGINTPAETWQIDFTARMAGMDERQRRENIDIYGAAAFFGDGYLVGKIGNQFYVTAGAGYVAGLRSQLDANQNVTVTTKPVLVWLDVCWTGTLASVWSVQSKLTVAESLADYEQNGVKHYVFSLASIDANGAITDLRPKGTLGEQQANSDYVRKDKNLADLKDKAEARRILELKTAAIHDVQTSRDDVAPGRVLVNGGAIALRTVAASGGGGAYTEDCNNLPANSVSFVYGSAKNSPGFEASVLDFSGLDGVYRTQIAASYSDGGKRIRIRTCNADIQTWNAWKPIITADGGSVDYLDNARYYNTRGGMWQGGGAFVNQLGDGTAPFCVPKFTTPKDNSVYLPICKGISNTEVHDYSSAVSFGILRSGNPDFGAAVIQIIGDSGTGAIYTFQNNGTFVAPGSVNAGSAILGTNGDVNGTIWNGWLNTWLNNQFAARDAGINDRATYDYVNNRTHWWTNGESGWWKDENTGFIYQWTVGPWVKDDEGIYPVGFPMRFPNQCCTVNVGSQSQGDGNRNDANAVVYGWNQDICQVQMNIPGESSWWHPMRAIIFAIGR